MAVVIIILIILFLFIATVVNGADSAYPKNYQEPKANFNSILDKINLEFLNNTANQIKEERQIEQAEALFLAACRIIDLIDREKRGDKNVYRNPLESPYSIARINLLGIISENYPDLQDRFMDYLKNRFEDKEQSNSKLNDKIFVDKLSEKLGTRNNNSFDFTELINYNANIIVKEENKDIREATYLAICLIYDDLMDKRSPQGIQDLMSCVQSDYSELFNDVMTYAAWKYQPQLVFKPEFDEYMRKRHSK